MVCPANGTGTTVPEQFTLYRPDGGSSPILPGETMIMKSDQTGKYCRITVIGGLEQILCDQDTPATATPFTYTGSGMSYNGKPLVSPGGGLPSYFGPSGSAPTPATFVPPPLEPNTPVRISVPSQGFLRVDNLTSYAYCGDGDGTTPPELFYVAQAEPAATDLVKGGQTAFLISAATGKYCRLAVYTGDPSNYVVASATGRAQKPSPPPPAAHPPAACTRRGRQCPAAKEAGRHVVHSSLSQQHLSSNMGHAVRPGQHVHRVHCHVHCHRHCRCPVHGHCLHLHDHRPDVQRHRHEGKGHLLPSVVEQHNRPGRLRNHLHHPRPK
jgi:hypothetical protein